ncbi:MAG TPA: DUF2167 domain-containing protein [Mariprofundaceae bacterium]|nr:DUF2167 domain-containing protein [Mariprofundaceae bacterium]
MRATRISRWAFAVLAGIQLFMAPTMFAGAAENAITGIHHSQAVLQAAYRSAGAAMQKGPAEIAIADQAVLRLPAGFGFVPATQARQLMQAMGNPAGSGLQGMIFPTTAQRSNWCIIVNYVGSGHIEDNDTNHWDDHYLLTNIRSITEDANESRRARGTPEVEVLDWVEKPRYDPVTHQLVWAVSSRNKAELKDADHSINYNIIALGRSGYVSMNLVTALSVADRLKPVAHLLAADLSFRSGDRYDDFDANIDKAAGFGLAALVAGVAAQKLGLLALIASFFTKFAKAIGVAMAAGMGIMGKKIWVRKRAGRQDVAQACEPVAAEASSYSSGGDADGAGNSRSVKPKRLRSFMRIG